MNTQTLKNIRRALCDADRFMSGFEDDETQRGIKAKLRRIRLAIHSTGENLLKPVPRIVIACDGGLVQGVVSDIPLSVEVIDYDVEGADLEEIELIRQDDGTDSEATTHSEVASVDTVWIDRMRSSKPEPAKEVS